MALVFFFSGACMNIVSSCVQLCKTVRDLTYDLMTSYHKDRLKSCLQSIGHNSHKLVKLLEEHDVDRLLNDYQEKISEGLKLSKLSVSSEQTCSSSVSTLSSNFSFSPNVSPVDNRSLADSLNNSCFDGGCQNNHADKPESNDRSINSTTSFSSSENSLASR